MFESVSTLRESAPKPGPESTPKLAHRDLRSDTWWQRVPAWDSVDEATFQDHRWQTRNTVKKVDDLRQILGDEVPPAFLDDVEAGIRRAPMSVRITPYLVSLIDWSDPVNDPIRRQFLPLGSTAEPDHPELTLDSLAEQDDAVATGLTHRYPDKALFLALDTCPVYCRFCTRSYAVGMDTENVEKLALRPNPKRWEDAFAYIESHPELEDIVISGGDVFNLGAKWIRDIGMRLLQMPHIRRIRYATKGVAVMPQKILTDDPWVEAMGEVATFGRSEGKAVALHTHFNHATEITEHSEAAVLRLMDEGITVRNQAVLQRGVNDSVEAMTLLVKRLSYINVQPYYVYVHDLVSGVEELRTTVQTAIDIEKAVRGVTAGFNTPTFVVDAPGGGGKRDVHSFETYDRVSGVSIYTAPSIKPGRAFAYVDPIALLSDEGRELWSDAARRESLVREVQRSVA
jgi:lysine 2,3-aminomutase